MKLQDDFFRIIDITTGEKRINYRLQLNAEHLIYAAHFPGNPITPGVCIIQMIKELVELCRQKELFLKKLINAKFLNVLNPLENGVVSLNIVFEEEEKVTATIEKEEVIFAKISLELVEK
ncbi:MAG: 3-hydroxyacyl-ACP dehydratase [Bacteroidales bacterium]|jgi:3-hydroxyacyl-[acyl-carrier-protein] dehydratase|nr:3-hydroxyacyl-ACP dehydratase [Bacteroidales bacterium]